MSVVPQNLPSHILQNWQRACFKIPQGLITNSCLRKRKFFEWFFKDISICILKDPSIGSRLLKGCTVQMPHKPVKIRVLFLSRNLRFSKAQSSLMCLYTLSSIYMSCFKTHRVKFHSQKLQLLYSQLQG